MVDRRPHSRQVTVGVARAPARAMLRAVGFEDADFDRPQVGIAAAGNDLTPCNVTLHDLAANVAAGVRSADAVPMRFSTVAISDGIAMGHTGMRASLPSRDLIADSVECVMQAEQLDALVTIAGCDKSLPAMLMAAARINVAAVFLYGGTSRPGRHGGLDVTVQDVFEAVGAHAAGRITDAELDGLERAACPGAGSCAGMYTANTVAAEAEALGLALPGSATPPAATPDRIAFAEASGAAAVHLLDQGIRARDILTRPAFENAITTVMALGGSSNAVLHLSSIMVTATRSTPGRQVIRPRPSRSTLHLVCPLFRSRDHTRLVSVRTAWSSFGGLGQGRPPSEVQAKSGLVGMSITSGCDHHVGVSSGTRTTTATTSASAKPKAPTMNVVRTPSPCM